MVAKPKKGVLFNFKGKVTQEAFGYIKALQHCNFSACAIGRLLGGMNHTTVRNQFAKPHGFLPERIITPPPVSSTTKRRMARRRDMTLKLLTKSAKKEQVIQGARTKTTRTFVTHEFGSTRRTA